MHVRPLQHDVELMGTETGLQDTHTHTPKQHCPTPSEPSARDLVRGSLTEFEGNATSSTVGLRD